MTADTQERQNNISQKCAKCGRVIDTRRPEALCTECQIAKHTDGPWHVATYGEPVKWLSVKRGPETIARIEAVDTNLDAEGKANAHLIAAAPELLAALQQCVEQLDRETLGGEALDNARAIIQKARGQ